LRPEGSVLSFTSKRNFALLFLFVASPALAAEFGDINVPLEIKSRFVIRETEGPPTGKKCLNRYAASYLFEFKQLRYRREISFTPSQSYYVTLRDFYGDYELTSFRLFALSNYLVYRKDIVLKNTWREEFQKELGKSESDEGKGAVQIDIPWEPPKIIGRIIGEGKSNIRVTGSRSITFSGRSEWEEGLVNTGTFKQSKFPTLHMEQKSRFKVTGTIGSKITVEVDQDSERYTELANTIKLRYKGEEDEIIQTVEAGNTNLALPNSQFIGYSENVKGLFGIKATAKIGNLDLTMITSQDKGSNEKASFVAGAKGTERQIRDYDYLPDTYFRLWEPGPTDSLLSIELYTNGSQQEDPKGIACVWPLDSLPNITPEQQQRYEYKYMPFKQIDPTEFEVYKEIWSVVLNNRLTQYGSVLAAYITYARYNNGSVDTLAVGNLSYRPDPSGNNDTTLVLVLLKHDQSVVEFDSWDRTWRNVYDLGARDISIDGFELRIFKGAGGQQGLVNDIEDQNGECFVTVLGLDDVNNGTRLPPPDCLFDFDNTVIDAHRGHLVFPHLRPFDSEALEAKVPEIYENPYGNRIPRDSSQYYLYVRTAQRAASYSLGRANIIEGSEVVKLGDGTILQRGADYNINYDIGQITFISEQATNPAANITVDFDYAPFFSPEKKSLFGLASQYQLFENSFVSFAAMYRSETASDPRPRVGREPTKAFVWDGNFSFNFKPEFMTTMVDVLPFVEADAQSSLDISGEVAQSIPNPNTKNQAFIDDFEGTRTYTDLNNRRGVWTACSPPLNVLDEKLDLDYKTDLWWYNPFDPVRIREIWPERDVRAQDDRHDVLNLQFFPDSTADYPDSSWAGIMRPIFSGMADHSQTKFIELWYHPDLGVQSGAPLLHIDLGLISEDLDDDGDLDSEDANLNGVLLPEEDTGLDGLFSESEPGYDPVSNPDPNGDDWYYSNDEPNNYSQINGTEENRNDPDRLGRFDTEDINNNGSLDEQDGYFEYTVDLNDPEYWADSTSTGWQLLRIPLQDSLVYRLRGVEGSADFTRLSYARIWLAGATEPYHLQIASFQLIGNKWQEVEIELDSLDYWRPGEKFEVTVKNTQENLNYYPPPGIAGELDRETGVREKEQSLVLAYQNMPPGHLGAAYWNLYQPEDYTLYQRLQMFVHGDSSSDGYVTFFFQMSQDGSNFYEYRTVLEPGWSENNWVDIDFARLTELKYELHKRTPPESLAVADTTDGPYRIHGNPSLSQVKIFIAGVEIDTAASETDLYSGEVWLDELRVTDVRRKSDFAGRLQATAKFSDFADATVSYQKTGADFFPLSAKQPSGATTTNRSLRLGMKVDRLFPPSLGMSLPVTYSWQNTLSLPRLKPGSDIILQGDARSFERTENTQKSQTVSVNFNKNTNNPIWNLTLNRIRSNYTFSRTEGRSPATPESELIRYQGKTTYDLSPRSKASFRPFFWMKYLFLPKSLYGSQFFYLPTKLDFSGEISGNNTRNLNQRGILTESRTKDLLLSSNLSLGLFSTLRSNYSLTASRDLTDPGRFKLSINPSKLKLGREQRFQQRFDISYQPSIIKLIDNKVSFSSSYNEDSDLKRNVDSTRTTDMQGSLKTDLTFNLPLLFSRGGAGKTPQMQKQGEKKVDDDRLLDEDEDEDEESGHRMVTPKRVFGGILQIFKSVKPVRATYQKDKKLARRGLLERPHWTYMFGFADDPRAETKTTSGLTGTDNTVLTDSYSLESGLQPIRDLDIRTSYSLRTQITRGTTDPTKLETVTFPDVTVNLTGLENFALFKSVARTVGWQFGYSKKVDENGREDTGELYKRDTAKLYSPIFGLNITFTNGIRGTIRYDKSNSFSKNLRSQGQSDREVKGSDSNFKINLSYSFSAPKGLKLPFLKRVKFDSQLSLSLDVSISNTKSESVTSGRKSVDSDRKNITVEPRLSYQFSRAISGGLRARWNDSDDKIQQRKHHVRELGIWTEIKF
jgi:cell surface protein SprA